MERGAGVVARRNYLHGRDETLGQNMNESLLTANWKLGLSRSAVMWLKGKPRMDGRP